MSSPSVNFLPFPVVAGLTLAGFACCDTFGGTGHMGGCEDKPQPWALQSGPQGVREPAQPTGICPQPRPVGGPGPTLCCSTRTSQAWRGEGLSLRMVQTVPRVTASWVPLFQLLIIIIDS